DVDGVAGQVELLVLRVNVVPVGDEIGVAVETETVRMNIDEPAAGFRGNGRGAAGGQEVVFDGGENVVGDGEGRVGALLLPEKTGALDQKTPVRRLRGQRAAGTAAGFVPVKEAF